MPGTRLVGLDLVRRDEMDVRPQEMVALLVENDPSVHLGQFGQLGRSERHGLVEDEAATRDGLHVATAPEHDDRALAHLDDPFQARPKTGSRSEALERCEVIDVGV